MVTGEIFHVKMGHFIVSLHDLAHYTVVYRTGTVVCRITITIISTVAFLSFHFEGMINSSNQASDIQNRATY